MKRSHQPALRVALPILFLALAIVPLYANIAGATDVQIWGGQGGNYFRVPCPQGSYLVGLAGRAGEWVDRIAPVCAPWLRGSQTFGAHSVGEFHGTSTGGQELIAICRAPNGSALVVSSWTIETLRSANRFVRYIGAMCSPILPSPSLPLLVFFEFGSRPSLPDGSVELSNERVTPGPIKSGQGIDQSCPAGEAPVGIHLRAGQFVDAVGLICGPLPPGLGVPARKLPGPLIQAPQTAVPINPQTKNMRIPDDMFVITKPATEDRVPQGQLVITATIPKVGATNVTELELIYLDAPPAQQNSYPYTTVFSVDTKKLVQGYPVAPILTGAYPGLWQVRARSAMKTLPGPWSNPVKFHMVNAPLPPPMVQMPKLNAPITQTPAPGSSVVQAPAPSSATTQMKSSPFMVRPRGVDEKGGKEGHQTVDQPAENEKRP